MTWKSILILICVALLSIIPITASAHEDEDDFNLSTFSGVVTAVNGNTIQLMDGKFTFDLSTAKILVLGEPGNISSIKVGSAISVSFQDLARQKVKRNAPHPPIQARQVDVRPQDFVLLAGFFENVDLASRSLVVFKQRILTNNETRFFGYTGANGPQDIRSLEDVASSPNKTLVTAVRRVGADLVATVVGVVPDDLTAESVTGFIGGYPTDVKGNRVELFDGLLSFNITNAELFAQQTNRPITADALKQSYLNVNIRNLTPDAQLSGTNLAEASIVQATVRDAFDFFGPVQKIHESSFTLFNQRIVVNAETKFIAFQSEDDKEPVKGVEGLKLLRVGGRVITGLNIVGGELTASFVFVFASK